MIAIILDCLASSEERIILQTLKLLSKLSDFENFRLSLHQEDNIFHKLKAISSNTDSLANYQMEIETVLCTCLDKITQIDQADTYVDMGLCVNHLSQIKIFNGYLIQLALQKQYTVERMDITDARGTGSQTKSQSKVSKGQNSKGAETPMVSFNRGKMAMASNPDSHELTP